MHGGHLKAIGCSARLSCIHDGKHFCPILELNSDPQDGSNSIHGMPQTHPWYTSTTLKALETTLYALYKVELQLFQVAPPILEENHNIPFNFYICYSFLLRFSSIFREQSPFTAMLYRQIPLSFGQHFRLYSEYNISQPSISCRVAC